MEIQKQTSSFGILKTKKNKGEKYVYICLGHIRKEKENSSIK
jgi:hypothetical protein